MLALALVLLSPSAHALTSKQGGPSLDLAAGLGLRSTPVRPQIGGQLSLGGWTGVYDDQYAFGKYWWFGATGRVDWHPSALGIAPMFELRRGLELFVVGVAPFLAGGPVLVLPSEGEAALGATARLGMMAKMRRTRFLGVSLRLEGGVDIVGGEPGFAGATLLGLSWARPSRHITAPEI